MSGDRGRPRTGNIVGGYRLGKRIGEGGNGCVFVVQGESSIVCKVHTRNTHEARTRFEREVRVQRSLRHAGVLPILETNVDGETMGEFLWFSMPRAKPLLEHATRLPVFDRVELLQRVASTLADLASEGIHHRDIKPSNLLIGSAGPLVADFGLVSTPADLGDLTAHRDKLGSQFYIPPEMINSPGEAHGAAADVYSFAKTAWVILSGQTYPVPGVHDADGSARLTSLLPDVSNIRAIDVLLEGMTSDVPSRRPEMRVVAAELAAWGRKPDEVASTWPDLGTILASAMVHRNVVEDRAAIEHRTRTRVVDALGRLTASLETVIEHVTAAGAPVFRRDRGGAFQYDASDVLGAVSVGGWSAATSQAQAITVCHSALIGSEAYGPWLRPWAGVVQQAEHAQAQYVVGSALHQWGGQAAVLWVDQFELILGAPSEPVALATLAEIMTSHLQTDLIAWRDAVVQLGAQR